MAWGACVLVEQGGKIMEDNETPFLTSTGKKLVFIMGCMLMAWVGVGLLLQGAIMLFRFVN